MFNIYGGQTRFTQWTQGQKLIMNELPVGADVQFYQDPNEDDPLITEVYEFTEEDGTVTKVCDVPNILLTETLKIKAHVDSTVYGAYGVAYNVIGTREKYFEIDPAEKPADYVYEETPLKGCGCEHGNVSNEQIEDVVNKYLEEKGITVVDGVAIYAEIVD